MSNLNLNLKGLWLPIEILTDKNLSDKEKHIYSIVMFLIKENNYCYCKENETTYIREFDRMKKEYDLQGNLRKNSIIMCQMMITSDNEFFKKIGLEETKRYFIESYKLVEK